jgi:hypothetical protein
MVLPSQFCDSVEYWMSYFTAASRLTAASTKATTDSTNRQWSTSTPTQRNSVYRYTGAPL